MHKHGGFTLLEALLVFGALIIISAIAAPGIVTWRDNIRLQAAAERFGEDLQKAKSRAVRDVKTVIVKLQSNTYRIFVDTGNGNGGPPNGTYDHHEPVVCERHLTGGIRLKFNGPASSTFSPARVAEDLPVEFESPEVDIDPLEDDRQSAEASGGRPGIDGGWRRKLTGEGQSSKGTTPATGPASFEDDDDRDDHNDQATDSVLAAGMLQPDRHPDRLSFDYIGRCLNPQNFILENSRGKKKLVAVNTLGNVKVIKVD